MRLRLAVVVLFVAAAVAARAQLAPETEAKIAAVAESTLKETGVPSASIAVAQGGKIVYAKAFGLADVAAKKPADAAMAYPIGSISKQFTAQAVLLLQERGKLSIDDPVGKYFPELTRSNEVTLRNLMTMTSGYEDFAPQDYIIPEWLADTTPLAVVKQWATKPLDFAPGTEWQYSNTNYVILGLIVEKVTGEPLMKFVRKNLLEPLHLAGVFNTYEERGKLEVTGYVSNAMAPVRVQPLEGKGWYFGDGDLSMPASSLAMWDVGVMEQKLLKPESYRAFETSYVLKSSESAGYGLGTFVRAANGHRMLEHSGEVGGYVAENIALPDDGLAIVVLTNEVASNAASKIARGVGGIVMPSLKPAAVAATEDPLLPTVKMLLTKLQQGTVDRAVLTSNCSSYFAADALADFRSTLAPLGELKDVVRSSTHARGGMTGSTYKATFANGSVTVSTYMTSDGKIEQFLVVGKA